MLYDKANKIFQEVYEQNYISTSERGGVYKMIVNDFLLKEEYGLDDKDLQGFKWESRDKSLEHGDAILKYTD